MISVSSISGSSGSILLKVYGDDEGEDGNDQGGRHDRRGGDHDYEGDDDEDGNRIIIDSVFTPKKSTLCGTPLITDAQ